MVQRVHLVLERCEFVECARWMRTLVGSLREIYMLFVSSQVGGLCKISSCFYNGNLLLY